MMENKHVLFAARKALGEEAIYGQTNLQPTGSQSPSGESHTGRLQHSFCLELHFLGDNEKGPERGFSALSEQGHALTHLWNFWLE